MARSAERTSERERVFLFSPFDPRVDEAGRAASQAELVRLLEGLGFEIVGTLAQRRRPDAGNLLGAGQHVELRAHLDAARAAAPGAELHLAVDANLAPGQAHFLERTFEVPVLDRAAVILRIFERRARTPTAFLEIELARLRWALPRVREIEAARDRTGGGGGRGERGASNAELARQRMRARIAELREKLEKLVASDEERRARRAGRRAALVGYTNAGKSSLMRALTGADVLVEDAPFATLGATVRTLAPPASPPIFVTDTVGFIRNLPHELVASFRSTLAEAREASLLVHVVDGSDPEWPAQMRTTRESLAAIGAGDLPELLVFNKADGMTAEQRAAIASAHPEALVVSAHDPDDVLRLREAIVATLDASLEGALLDVPHAQARRLGEIRERAHVLAETWTETGVRLSVRAAAVDLAAWADLRDDRPPPHGLEDLLERARLHGLDLLPTRDRLDDSGVDFLVAHAEDEAGRPWVVRAPRHAYVVDAARAEARALALVRRRLPVEVPDWRIHTPSLIAYPRLGGTPALTVDGDGVNWNVIDPDAPGEAFLASYARLLAAMQAVPAVEARRAGVCVRTIDEERAFVAASIEAAVRNLDVPEQLRARWLRWIDDDRIWPTHVALCHGDLHPGHLLLDPDGAIRGVLDWTEARVGDPGTDLAVAFGCLGRTAFADLVARFERAGGRIWPGLRRHVEERWIAWPAIAAEFALRNGNEAVLADARREIAAAAAQLGI